MSTAAIIATTAAVTAVVTALAFVAYIRFGTRACLHDWAAWEPYTTAYVYDVDFGTNMPVGKRLVSLRECVKCGKTISRKQRV